MHLSGDRGEKKKHQTHNKAQTTNKEYRAVKGKDWEKRKTAKENKGFEKYTGNIQSKRD